MAKRILVPITITSPMPDGECTQYYIPRFKPAGDPNWTTMANTVSNPIVLEPALPATLYDIEISRLCCNGELKTQTTTFTTSA